MAAHTTQQAATSLRSELDCLPVEGACAYYLNYLNNFQADLPLAVNFFNRMLGEAKIPTQSRAKQLLDHALLTAARLAPFDPAILNLAAQSGLSPDAARTLAVVTATNAEPAVQETLAKGSMRHQGEEIRRAATALLHKHPMYVLAADLLLSLDFFEGKRPGEVTRLFRCPTQLKPLWTKRLFNHLAGLGDAGAAALLWPEVEPLADDPFTLNRAAEMLRMQGDAEGARELYARSLTLDGLQRPVRLRLAELASPFTPDRSLPGKKKVCIYLYSYNKAEVLAETLQSLAGCDIADARVKLLLNGCTDDSRSVAARLAELFPRNRTEVIELPVNIGAPAARNWLISHEDTWASDYVAFLDDDVDLQPDWLAHFLTVAEADQRIANVGCKVVFPGEFRLLQYLFRDVSIATDEVIRVSLPVPFMQYDIGLYDVVRPTRVVMGCQHMMRVSALRECPWFDIRYSPSQIDDTDHDLQFGLKGHRVGYCGTVTCVHKHGSGVSLRSDADLARQGNVAGNDLKFFYKFYTARRELAKLDSLSLNS